MPSPGTTRCRTRCCDAQCAGAIVVSINAISTARRGGRVNREVPCWQYYDAHECHLSSPPVVVPVVVMLSAPVPLLLA